MQVIALISGKGGVGKTTLTANLAVALAQRQARVLVIDLDPQNAQRLHLGMDPDDISGLVREGIHPDSIFDSPFGVHFIPFGQVLPQDLAEFEDELDQQPHWLADRIALLEAAAFDFVLLDTPPGSSVFLQQAMQAAHRALIVLMPDAASYATLAKFLDLVQEYTAQREDFYGADLLINQMPAQNRLGHQVREALYESHGKQLVPVAIHKDARVAEALAFERPVLEYEPGCKTSLDVQYLADWVLDSHQQ
ncbi:cellulose biosynthesis protein BcsQ [Noviherbaspirillum malthae]|uniref:cellulose biosynthesis protein BcsQ n=1 Tax=Noviherbaspirillum malthae TaxID=1260987 RepID=UPI00188F6FEC|nr:cellulose biosynthesis protein BcsQ [Noviherbaspirillum malthae]